jgi:UDP-N-acetylmuramyl pentapeptide phosphotransferase/UDP-N-acetylglucosamine-1-phosphate transferase
MQRATALTVSERMGHGAASLEAVAASAAFVLAAVIAVAIIVAIRPWLQRIALAKPNARSSHREPTPQGGGIAVIAATIIAAAGALFLSASAASAPVSLLPLLAAVIVIAAVGAADDIRPIGVTPRFVLQAFSVALVIFALPDELRVAPFAPIWIERLLLVLGGLWFVNLVNFMDGLDWMTVAEVVPITAALAIFGAIGLLPATEAITSVALCGAMIGFAYFNRPVARLFLGDVGSLPIGLLLGWLLVQLASRGGGVAAAILLPLYYLADATITLVRRLAAGEKVWQAHRSHFYQRATDRGFTVRQVVARVFAVNIALAALAFVTLAAPTLLNDAATLVCGAALVGWLLLAFARGKGVVSLGPGR